MFIVQEKIYTYSADFFMIAFFTLRARGVSTTVLVAGGEVTPAGGAVPARATVTAPIAEADGSVPTMATVTAPVAEADGSVPTSWRSGSGGEAGGLQKDNVSVQQYRYMTTRQEIHTWRTPLLVLSVCAQLDNLAGPKAEFRSTPRMVRVSCPFLPPPRLPFPPGGSYLQWTRCRQSLGYSSPLRFGCGAGEKVVRSRDVGLWRVAPVQFCVSLQKDFS
jgi:hypothetical protein